MKGKKTTTEENFEGKDFIHNRLDKATAKVYYNSTNTTAFSVRRDGSFRFI